MNDVIRRSGNIDVRVISGESEGRAVPRAHRRRYGVVRLNDYLVGLGLVLIAGLAAKALRMLLSLPDPAMVFLTGVLLTTDWRQDFHLPANIIKGGLCCSGLFDLKPVRLSARSTYVNFTDEMEQAMSPQRHLDQLRAPVVVTYGTNETPEFQRQARDFAAAVKAAGKSVELIEAPNYNHYEMGESFGNPYGPSGRAALALMKLPILG